MPKTSVIVTTLLGVVGTLIALLYSVGAVHWTDPQKAGVAGLAAATIMLIGAVVEHVRKETPSRWVAVLGFTPTWITSLVVVGSLFGWFQLNTAEVNGYIVAILAPILALFGVAIAQNEVFSPETHEAVVDAAHAETSPNVN